MPSLRTAVMQKQSEGSRLSFETLEKAHRKLNLSMQLRCSSIALMMYRCCPTSIGNFISCSNSKLPVVVSFMDELSSIYLTFDLVQLATDVLTSERSVSCFQNGVWMENPNNSLIHPNCYWACQARCFWNSSAI